MTFRGETKAFNNCKLIETTISNPTQPPNPTFANICLDKLQFSRSFSSSWTNLVTHRRVTASSSSSCPDWWLGVICHWTVPIDLLPLVWRLCVRVCVCVLSLFKENSRRTLTTTTTTFLSGDARLLSFSPCACVTEYDTEGIWNFSILGKNLFNVCFIWWKLSEAWATLSWWSQGRFENWLHLSILDKIIKNSTLH